MNARTPSVKLQRALMQAAAASVAKTLELAEERCDEQALLVPRAATPTAPERLAAANPGDAATRERMREVYARCLEHYRRAGKDDRVDDLGLALANFVAANLVVLDAGILTPRALTHMRRQLGGFVTGDPLWTGATLEERQFRFEQIAILGVFVREMAALARRESPAAVENVRRAARGYLKELLGLDASAWTIGPRGLQLRAPVAAAA